VVTPPETVEVERAHAAEQLEDRTLENGRHDRVAVGTVGVPLVPVQMVGTES
jgi:hypothetical protein